MRKLLLLCLALSALTGCAQPDEPEAEPLEVVPEEPVLLEPVRIQERIDLRDGLPETQWSVRLGPGHEERRIVASLEPVDGASMIVMQNFCYFFEGRPDDGERIRHDGGTGCHGSGPASSGGAPRVLVHMDAPGLPDGDYRFVFSAKPALAVLVMEMVGEPASGDGPTARS